MVGRRPCRGGSALAARARVSLAHALEHGLVRALARAAAARPWPEVLAYGERLGDLARSLGVRRRVAAENLARAFPERSEAERAAILDAHYREVGRVAVEYARLGDLARAEAGRVVAGVRGEEHLEAVRAAGRGAILLTGHYGNFELLGAALGRRHPVDFVVRPLSNPRVDAWLAQRRREAGVGSIPAHEPRRIYAALRQNRWVAMLADQDARRAGTFVTFLGRPASTPLGPARVSLHTGAPIVMGFATRRPDRRLELDVEPPIEPGDRHAPGAAERLTARHVERLESWVRRRPEMWFWLHRRWKTSPPERAA